MAIHNQVASSPLFIKIPFITIATSGALILHRTHGTESKQRSVRQLGRGTGEEKYLLSDLLINNPKHYRMAMWKHYIVLFGGFYDPGLRSKLQHYSLHTHAYFPVPANYLNDLWLFDTQEYRWKQVEFKDTERKPS